MSDLNTGWEKKVFKGNTKNPPGVNPAFPLHTHLSIKSSQRRCSQNEEKKKKNNSDVRTERKRLSDGPHLSFQFLYCFISSSSRAPGSLSASDDLWPRLIVTQCRDEPPVRQLAFKDGRGEEKKNLLPYYPYNRSYHMFWSTGEKKTVPQ